jgi:hypothetical protein
MQWLLFKFIEVNETLDLLNYNLDSSEPTAIIMYKLPSSNMFHKHVDYQLPECFTFYLPIYSFQINKPLYKVGISVDTNKLKRHNGRKYLIVTYINDINYIFNFLVA